MCSYRSGVFIIVLHFCLYRLSVAYFDPVELVYGAYRVLCIREKFLRVMGATGRRKVRSSNGWNEAAK